MTANTQKDQPKDPKINKEQSIATVSTSTNNPLRQYDGLKPVYLICLIAIVISVLALIESIHFSRQGKHFNNFESGQTTQITKKLILQDQQLSTFSNQLQQLQATIQSNQLKIEDAEATLKDLKQAKFASNTRWMLAEIKYLLTLAQYNLQLNHDPQTALTILETVDNRLGIMNDPNSLILRQQVIIAINNLQPLTTIDYPGILMKLNAIANQLKSMPLLANIPQGTQKTLSTSSETTGWHKYWNDSLKTLEKLLIIRHQNESVAPLISPKEQIFLIQNIQSKLSQASWALLNHNQEVFNLSLQDAMNWIQIYYSQNSAATTNALSTLQSLMTINLQPALPDLSKLIRLADNILNSTTSVTKGAQ